MSEWGYADAIKLFNRVNYVNGIGDTFTAGDNPDLTGLKLQVVNSGVLVVVQSTESFKLRSGYGVTFYKDPGFKGPFRSFYAVDADLQRAFVGSNMNDRTLGGITFDHSSTPMINNVGSMKVFKIQTRAYCAKPSISDRDICRELYGDSVIQSVGTDYRSGVVTPGAPMELPVGSAASTPVGAPDDMSDLGSGVPPETSAFSWKWILVLVVLVSCLLVSNWQAPQNQAPWVPVYQGNQS